MKKLVSILILTIGMITQFALGSSVEAEVISNPVAYQSGIGYTINVASAEYADASKIKIGSPILSTTFLQNVTLNRINLNTTESFSSGSSSFASTTKGMNANYGESTGVTYTDGFYSIGASTAYELAFSALYSRYHSQYYYIKQTDIKRYSLSLPNYSSDLSLYQSNLHSTFLSYVNKVKNGTMTTRAFFEKYGTHMIANGIYGGRLNLYYSVTSNQIDFTTSMQSSMKTKMDLAAAGLGGVTSSVNYSLGAVAGMSNANSNLGFYITAKGGSAFDIADFSQFSGAYQTWLASINDDQAVLVNFGDGGLIPIWEMLPDTSDYYSVKYTLASYFPTYLASYSDTQEAKFNFVNSSSYVTDNITIRSNTVYTNGATQSSNSYDVVSFANYYDLTANLMSSIGYDTVDIKLTIDIAEINDGYQIIRIYKNSETGTDNLLWEKTIQHGPGYKLTSYSTYTYTISDIPISSLLSSNSIYVRYDADGWWGNKWNCKNLKIELTFNKD